MFQRFAAKTIIVLALLLFVPQAWAQDVTCNAGDIAWVKETVNANVGHTTAPTGAEYNNFAAPFGIQRVFDQACAGLDIRILAGANNYNSASASWTNRDAADKQINIDTVAGALTGQILASGWVSETIRGRAALDFDALVTTGASGFVITQPQYVLRNLRVTNFDNIGIQFNATGILTLYNVEVDTNTTANDLISVVQGTSGIVIIDSYLHNGGAECLDGSGGYWVFRSELATCTGTGINNIGNLFDGSHPYNNAVIDSIIRNMGVHGIRSNNAQNNFIAGNTIDSNGAVGLLSSGFQTVHGMAIINNVFSRNGTYGLQFGDVGNGAAAGDSWQILAGNNFFGNVSGTINMTGGGGSGAVIRIDLDSASPDVTDPAFTAPSLQPAPGTVDFTLLFPSGNTDSPETKGAANAAGGGGAAGPPPPIIFQD